MRDRILEKAGVLTQMQSIVCDVDALWRRFDCDRTAKQRGYDVLHISDEMQLRQYYEYQVAASDDMPRILVIDNPELYVPFDIRRRFFVLKLSYETVFPGLSAVALRKVPNIDWDLLAFWESHTFHEALNEVETTDYCTGKIYSGACAEEYAGTLLEASSANAKTASGHREWFSIAQAFGKASALHAMGIPIANWDEQRHRIETEFAKWIAEKYSLASGTVDREQPVLLSHVADFVRRKASKVALIVMDGMSFSDFFTIQRALSRAPLTFDVAGTLSFFPTVTAVARQSIFSGKTPREHEKPFSLEREEKQWLEYWRNYGLKDSQVFFQKGLVNDVPVTATVCGIVINIVDDLMHAELQGLSGMQQGLTAWVKTGKLQAMLQMLVDRGYSVFMTSDHGNTSAIAQGRYANAGVVAEPASRRAILYDSSFDARELDKFTHFRYAGTYLPEGYTAYLFEDGTCYGEKGKEYITHGGMTIEEAVVPFVRIGEWHG